MDTSSLNLSSCRKIRRLAVAAALLACVLISAFLQHAPAQTSPNSGGPNYRDPQGRFTLRIPEGWKTSLEVCCAVVSW
jgi:hypothetical protein